MYQFEKNLKVFLTYQYFADGDKLNYTCASMVVGGEGNERSLCILTTLDGSDVEYGDMGKIEKIMGFSVEVKQHYDVGYTVTIFFEIDLLKFIAMYEYMKQERKVIEIVTPRHNLKSSVWQVWDILDRLKLDERDSMIL